MFRINHFTAKSLMKNNIIRSFFVYLSDYLSLILFFTSLISVFYLFIFDTTFLTSIGVYTNELTLGIVSFIAVSEITILYFIYYYAKLRKCEYFSVNIKTDITFYDTVRISILSLITLIKKIVLLFIFLSPFMLTVSATFILEDNLYPSDVIYVFVGCASLLFVFGLIFYRMYILKFSLVNYVFLNNKNLSYTDIYNKAENMTDGKIIRLFILKTMNLPKKTASLLVFPSMYFLPFCLYSEYDFLLQKENPYPSDEDTEKSVVFYLRECEN